MFLSLLFLMIFHLMTCRCFYSVGMYVKRRPKRSRAPMKSIAGAAGLGKPAHFFKNRRQILCRSLAKLWLRSSISSCHAILGMI